MSKKIARPVISTIAILLLLLGTASGVASGSSSSYPLGVPAGLTSYISEHPAGITPGCVTGTVSPFTIQPCNPSNDSSDNVVLSASSTTQQTNCDTHCWVQEEFTASTNFTQWAATSSVNANLPSTTYHWMPSSLSYWAGLECTSCTIESLLQGGWLYGVDSSYTSQHPVMFVEYWTASGTCNTFTNNTCGTTRSVSKGDDIYIEVAFSSGSPREWLTYTEDLTSGIYIAAYFDEGTGSTQVHASSMQEGLVDLEAKNASLSSYYPGGSNSGENFYNIEGWGTSYSPATPTGTGDFNPVGPPGLSYTISGTTGTECGTSGTYYCASYTLSI